nr:hypothetical protein [Enterovibrio nigricans]
MSENAEDGVVNKWGKATTFLICLFQTQSVYDGCSREPDAHHCGIGNSPSRLHRSVYEKKATIIIASKQSNFLFAGRILYLYFYDAH